MTRLVVGALVYPIPASLYAFHHRLYIANVHTFIE